MESIILLLNDARGHYIPQNFAECFNVSEWGLDPESWEVKSIEDSNSEHYWDAWDQILNKAEYHKDGNVWRLHQDGDLWAICYELMTDEEKNNFGFEG
jgi:hypothetical protein